MKFELKQRYFVNKDNGKIVAFVQASIISSEFGALPLTVENNIKKMFNFKCRNLGFVIGEVDKIPTEKTLLCEVV